MKFSAACLSLLLTAAILSTQLPAQPVSVSIPVTCCFDTVQKKIPMKRLQNYTMVNNSHCPQEAVIFKTKLGKKICADPKKKWVKTLMKRLNSKSQKLKSQSRKSPRLG
ncbi:C-C motif chemokine 8-like [Sorex araneus]|uniref:C-C motif chemokine 8-like n=1 Tax=Sorex araneus TaxID=42254 RepID=UPI002433A441|nr:C-C motif chemokine 8-like [Sorex araneus]